MTTTDPDRTLLGCFCVAIFGRSVTLALQHLETWDERAFREWYAPWRAEMRGDPLCRFFYVLRTDILHDVVPMVGVMLGGWGPSARPVGTISFHDRKLPTEHRGKPIEDTSTLNLCRLYVAYLEELVQSSYGVVRDIQDRWQAAQSG
ncbi:MAG: hypothetical protein ACLQGJ_04560 [Candidatus Dormibacteria bacterium]